MSLRFYNTLTQQLEEFKPLHDNVVRMYTCGPTVYNYAHIGNFRSFVFPDILRRWLRARGYQLDHVMNITDIEDKIIRDSKAAGKSIDEFTAVYTKAFLEDTATLRLERPERIVPATQHIPEMVEAVQHLTERGHTYVSDGSVYYRISTFPEYGKLSHNDFSGIRAGARVDVDEYDKDDARDFVLWKAAKEGEPAWDTPIGKGRPGWHIECSAMAMKYLGDTLDIHTGGVDLTFPASRKRNRAGRGDHGEAVRPLLAARRALERGFAEDVEIARQHLYAAGSEGARVRARSFALPAGVGAVSQEAQLHFRWPEGCGDLDRPAAELQAAPGDGQISRGDERGSGRAHPAPRRSAFDAALDDDLNTAEALGTVFEYIRDTNTAMDAGEFRAGNVPDALEFLDRFDSIFDVLKPTAHAGGLSDAEVDTLIAERTAAKKSKNFGRSDEIRAQLASQGVILEDTKEGVRWKRS